MPSIGEQTLIFISVFCQGHLLDINFEDFFLLQGKLEHPEETHSCKLHSYVIKSMRVLSVFAGFACIWRCCCRYGMVQEMEYQTVLILNLDSWDQYQYQYHPNNGQIY